MRYYANSDVTGPDGMKNPLRSKDAKVMKTMCHNALGNFDRPSNEGGNMRRTILFTVSLMVCAFANSQVLTLADIKAKNATQLTASELSELMPGAKVVNRIAGGSTHRWENKPDGTFVASTDGRTSTGGRNAFGTAPGTWRVTDAGKLCVKITWTTSIVEDWCRYVFKAEDMYYAVGRLEDNAATSEFEFGK